MDRAALLNAYLGGPDRLRSAVTGLSREQLILRPISGRWSVLEVVCHLVDTDANIAYRLKRVLSEERPVFDRVKPDLMLAALAYHERQVTLKRCRRPIEAFRTPYELPTLKRRCRRR
jgi:hypothetical protein